MKTKNIDNRNFELSEAQQEMKNQEMSNEELEDITGGRKFVRSPSNRHIAYVRRDLNSEQKRMINGSFRLAQLNDRNLRTFQNSVFRGPLSRYFEIHGPSGGRSSSR